MGLSPRHLRFVQEYLRDFNATRAAKEVGYSEKSAHVTGCKLLKDPKIADAVEEGKARVIRKAGLSLEECFAVFSDVALHGDPRDRIAAAEKLVKYQHRVADKVEHSGQIGLLDLVAGSVKEDEPEPEPEPSEVAE
jgi:phage terminase small subunit